MSVDPVANMLTKLKNASNARHKEVEIPYSKLKLEIVKLFKEEGFIKSCKVVEGDKFSIIKVQLKYTTSNEDVITQIKRVSKQGCRVYSKAGDIPRILNGLGVVIMSTSQGIITGKRAREELKIGGEIICYIW